MFTSKKGLKAKPRKEKIMVEKLTVTDQAAQAIKDFLSRRKGPNAVRIFLSAG